MTYVSPRTQTAADLSFFDKITVTEITTRGYHGVLPAEQELGQLFSADITLYTDLTAAASSDDLNDTINYADIAQKISNIIQGTPFKLLEALAQKILSTLLDTYPQVHGATLTLHKPQAPLDVLFQDVSVELTRCRPELFSHDTREKTTSSSSEPQPATTAKTTPKTTAKTSKKYNQDIDQALSTIKPSHHTHPQPADDLDVSYFFDK